MYTILRIQNYHIAILYRNRHVWNMDIPISNYYCSLTPDFFGKKNIKKGIYVATFHNKLFIFLVINECLFIQIKARANLVAGYLAP